MGIFNRKKKRADETKTSSWYLLNSDEAFEKLCVKGYTRLDRIPAVVSACRKIAELIGSMTIHLMANTENGDVRVVNELSRKIDINPCSTMTRSQFIEYIVMCMLLYGNGNAVVRVKTSGGYIEDFQPIPPSRFSLVGDGTGYGYSVEIDGVRYSPDDVLHFVYNPDRFYPWKGMGITTTLQALGDVLRQAQVTEKAFMESKWMPSVIIKADALTDEFSDPSGRRKLIDDYITTSEAGEPWIIPADQISVQEVRPLSLSDIALNESVVRDTKTVAALLGVPAFILGQGDYSQKEYNNFVQSKIRPLVVGIQQEMTRKIIISPKMYLRFNQRSLYDYDLITIATVYTSLQDRGDVTGNEIRDMIGLGPKEGLDELVRLENYIPNDMIAMQSKLKEEQDDGGK